MYIDLKISTLIQFLKPEMNSTVTEIGNFDYVRNDYIIYR